MVLSSPYGFFASRGGRNATGSITDEAIQPDRKDGRTRRKRDDCTAPEREIQAPRAGRGSIVF